MKKVLFLAAFLPAALLAQNITNTLGASGTFIVEDNTNKDVLLINPGSLLDNFIFGLHPSASVLPVGNYHFLGTVLPTSLDVYSLNTTPGSGSFIQLIRARGNDFNNPGTATAGDFLGTINFGAYNGTSFSSGLSSISSKIVTATGANPNVFSSDLEFQTASGSGTNKMTFDNAGSLTVPGAITSKAVTAVLGATYPASLSDQVIIVENNAATTITLPSANGNNGKTYTIKKESTGNFIITVNTLGGNIDGQNGATGVAIGGLVDKEFITLIAYGNNWFVIGRGNGF